MHVTRSDCADTVASQDPLHSVTRHPWAVAMSAATSTSECMGTLEMDYLDAQAWNGVFGDTEILPSGNLT